MDNEKKRDRTVVMSKTTGFEGVLRFNEAVCIQGKFKGTIDATGFLTVDKGAEVTADTISVDSITVFGKVHANIRAKNKVDLMSGAEVIGDVAAKKLRIADGVLFDGECEMIDVNREIDIFTHSQDEIKRHLVGIEYDA